MITGGESTKSETVLVMYSKTEETRQSSIWKVTEFQYFVNQSTIRVPAPNIWFASLGKPFSKSLSRPRGWIVHMPINELKLMNLFYLTPYNDGQTEQ